MKRRGGIVVWRAGASVIAAAALLALGLIAGSAAAMTLLPLDLAQLTRGADRIFVGRVESVQAGRDANGLPAIWTTFAVDQSVKGSPADHVTLKQLGAAFGGRSAPVVAHAELPRYRPGETVVLFLHPDSVLGFTSPVGLGQGCFRVREHDGGRLAENDLGNRNLAADAGARTAGSLAAPAPSTSAALPLETLLARVRTLVAAP